MNHEAPGGRRSPNTARLAAIAVAIVLALAVAVLVGVQFGQSMQASATSASTVSASPAPAATSAATTVESASVDSPEPEPVTETTAAPTASPEFEDPAPQPVVPAETFQVAPLPAEPPAAVRVEEEPAARPIPSPEPTCPADDGVALTIVKAELIREGGSLDQYKLTLVLDNRIEVPVEFSVMTIRITSVREDGAEMGSGGISLPDTSDVPPGRTTFTTEANNHATIFHGFGSPVTSFKLSGEVGVINGMSDRDSRVLFCEFNDIAFGKPLTGRWGS